MLVDQLFQKLFEICKNLEPSSGPIVPGRNLQRPALGTFCPQQPHLGAIRTPPILTQLQTFLGDPFTKVIRYDPGDTMMASETTLRNPTGYLLSIRMYVGLGLCISEKSIKMRLASHTHNSDSQESHHTYLYIYIYRIGMSLMIQSRIG